MKGDQATALALVIRNCKPAASKCGHKAVGLYINDTIKRDKDITNKVMRNTSNRQQELSRTLPCNGIAHEHTLTHTLPSCNLVKPSLHFFLKMCLKGFCIEDVNVAHRVIFILCTRQQCFVCCGALSGCTLFESVGVGG